MDEPALTPGAIIAGCMAALLQNLSWRKRPQSPAAPSNHAIRLIALLRRGGYVIVPRTPTAKMRSAARFWDLDAWPAMIGAWEVELQGGPRPSSEDQGEEQDDDRMPAV